MVAYLYYEIYLIPPGYKTLEEKTGSYRCSRLGFFLKMDISQSGWHHTVAHLDICSILLVLIGSPNKNRVSSGMAPLNSLSFTSKTGAEEGGVSDQTPGIAWTQQPRRALGLIIIACLAMLSSTLKFLVHVQSPSPELLHGPARLSSCSPSYAAASICGRPG